MTKEEFESYISPTILTFESFKQAVINSSFAVNNIDSVIFQEVLSFNSTSASFILPTNTCAVLILTNNSREVTSFTLDTPSPCYVAGYSLGTIFTTSIDPPFPISVPIVSHTFVIFRFD